MKLRTILGNRLLIRRVEKKLWNRIVIPQFGSTLDDEPIFEAEVVQVGTQFQWKEHINVGDRVFVKRMGGIVFPDKTILISALDIEGCRHNGKVEKLEAACTE